MNYTTAEKLMGIIDMNILVRTELLKEIEHHKEIALKMAELKNYIKDDPETFKKAIPLMRELDHSELRIKGLNYAQEILFGVSSEFDS